MKHRILALLVCLALVLGSLSGLATAGAEEPAHAVVIACSDFQNFEDSNGGRYTGSYTNNIALVQRIAGVMPYETVDGFLCGGDYNFTETMNNVSQTQSGVQAIHDTMKDLYPDLAEDHMVLVQGNHDAAGTPGMAVTGPYEDEAYSVYAINEDDYMDYNRDEARIKQTADNLEAYLAEKAEADYDHPIFVITHLPLHFTTRTQKNGDGQYAHYLFDVLNRYGEELNLIFIYGHNHAFGYDSYMGGSSVFLQRGDEINIANLGSRTRFTQEKLNFTYMNYGYVGYYWFNYDTGGGAITENPPADGTMTMTSFEITGNEVVIRRWDENGPHNLKAPGAPITKAMNGHDYEDSWPANDLSYGPVARVGAPAPLATYTDGNVSVTTAAPIGGIENLPVFAHETALGVEIRPQTQVPEGYTYTVTIRLSAYMATRATRVTQDGKNLAVTAAPDPQDPSLGTLCFRTDSLGTFHISVDDTVVSYRRITDPAALPETGQYLLFVSNTHKTSGSNLNADYVMCPVSKYVSSAGAEVPLDQAYRTGFDIQSALGFDVDNQLTLQGEEKDLEWTLARTGENWLLKTGAGEGVHFAYKDANAAVVTLSADDPTPLALARYGSTDTFTLGTAAAVNGVTYFFDYNTRGLICGYRAHANDVHFYLYQRQNVSGIAVDTSWLTEALSRAKALRETDYVPETWAPLAAAMAQAESLLAELPTDRAAAQTQVNAAWIDLNNAMERLELTLAKQGITYEAVTDLSALVPTERYYLVLWQDFGGRGDDSRMGYLVQPGESLTRVPTPDDYATLAPARALPESAAWHLAMDDSGVVLGTAGGDYLTGSGDLTGPMPTLLTLARGTVNGFGCYALGGAETALQIADGAMTWAEQSPAAAVLSATGCNLTLYRRVVIPERVNLAPDGIPDGPAISSWCNIAGVNDRVIPDSSDTGDYNVAYGSWNGSGSPEEQTITITLPEPACVEAAAAFFWYNADGPHTQVGIDFPASYTWEYLDDSGAWAPVPNADGLGTEEDVLNRTAFDPVTTTALRIVMQKEAAGSFGLGVAELELYGFYLTGGQTDAGPDPSALELALAKAAGVDPAPYTEQSVDALDQAVAAGLETLDVQDQAALDRAAAAILDAIAALEKKPDEPVEPDPTKPDDPDPTKPDDPNPTKPDAPTVPTNPDQPTVPTVPSVPVEPTKPGLPCTGDETCPGLKQFTDMPARGNWAHNPIDWAVVNEITNGMTETTFVSAGTITRGQAVTFLWRAAGKPAPEKTETPFTDLVEGAFYYDAVLWAVEKGITNGMTATTFNPGGSCTRGQIVTFLYRFAGSPEVDTSNSPFTDLRAGAFYTAPVAWAVANEITNGMSPTTFAPDATCTRAQVVTFLYRQQTQ